MVERIKTSHQTNMTDVTISTPTSRILSGSVGSIIYVLAFNPLEVVKIREQAMTTSTSTASSISSSSGIDRFMLPQQQMRRGVFSTIASIYRNEGRAALFTGVRPTLLAAIPNTAIYFTAYDEICLRLYNHHYSSNNNPSANIIAANNNNTNQLPLYIPLIAGPISRTLASFVTAPLEFVRTRQVTSNSNTSILEEFNIILRNNGPLTLYRGLGPMILRDVPFSAIYFMGLEACKQQLGRVHLGTWGTKYYYERDVEVPTKVKVLHSFVSGAMSGAVATMLTTPFDVLKTRSQMISKVDGEHQSAAANRSKVQHHRQGMFQHLRQIAKDEGFFTGLWKGNQTRMIKVAPGCAVMISCYELGKIWLN